MRPLLSIETFFSIEPAPETTTGLFEEARQHPAVSFHAARWPHLPTHMPPVKPIQLWAIAKLGLTAKSALRAAWGIAVNIAKRRSGPHPRYQGASPLSQDWTEETYLGMQEKLDIILQDLTAIKRELHQIRAVVLPCPGAAKRLTRKKRLAQRRDRTR